MSTLAITIKKPDLAYLGNFLWLPKSALTEEQREELIFALPSYNTRITTTIEFADDCGTHWRVPRMFRNFDRSTPVVDIRPKEFEPFEVKDLVTKFLDAEQEKAWQALAEADEGILNLACGRGKTVLAIKKAVLNGGPFLVVTNQLTTLNQWINAIRQFTNYRSRIGLVKASKVDFSPPVVVASAQKLLRLQRLSPKITHKFRTVIFDEVHHYAAPVLKQLLGKFWGKRLGLTATLRRVDGLEPVIRWHLGDVIYSDLRQPLRPEIFVKTTPVYVSLNAPIFNDVYGNLSVTRLRKYVAQLPDRVAVVADDVVQLVNHGHKVLVLTHYVNNAKQLAKAIPGATWVTGDIPQERRLDVFARHKVVCATLSIATEALDIPELSAVVFVTAFSNWNTFQQATGRALRKHPNKRQPVVVIYRDVGVKPLSAMVAKLLKEVEAHGYDYTTVYDISLAKFLAELKEKTCLF